jgi:hypothetical protein
MLGMQVVAHRVEFGFGPPAGHDAQQRSQLWPEPGLHGIRVGGDDEDRAVPAGPEDGDRDRGPGIFQVTEVEVQVLVAVPRSRRLRPAAGRGRARRRIPARQNRVPVLGTGLMLGPELAGGPDSDQRGRAQVEGLCGGESRTLLKTAGDQRVPRGTAAGRTTGRDYS